MAESLGFIELDRRFHQLSPNLKPEEAALESYTRALLRDDYGLTWSDLLKRRLVVILGEPGSGKTEEFKQQVRSGTVSDIHCFYIRLDQLATQALNLVLGSADYERYRDWQHCANRAIFFLDSVDEAKFQKLSDFYVALDKFRDAVGADAATRAQIFLSCRVSEWQPQSDRAELLERFPQPPPLRSQKDKSENAKFDDTEKPDPLLIVQLIPLDRSRVLIFAKARGVPNVEGFIEALDTSHAWEFARRPVDVIDLANFWSERGRLGSLTELIEFNVENNLRASARDQNDPLSPRDSREGAESLAAGVIFCRRFNFKVSDHSFLVEDAMDSLAIVPDQLRTEQVRALLNRPLFDGAAYGRIRFHHRRVTEYLAATWITARMKQGCPVTELKDLLFEPHESRLIIRPATATVAGWLCCGNESWNNDVRGWVLEAAPKIHLQYGDPACLPVEYKREVLNRLVRAYDGRSHIWITSEPESLARFADLALSQEIAGMIRNRRLSPDLRVELIQVVRYGRLVPALDAVLDVIACDDEPVDLKSYAAIAVRDAGDVSSRRRLAQIVASLTTLPNRICSRIFEGLYPEVIDASGLISLLRKTEPVPAFSVDIPYYLTTHLKSVLRSESVADVLERLIELGQTEPHLVLDYKVTPISQRFYWVSQVVPPLIDMLLRKPTLESHEAETVAKALWWLGLTRHHPSEVGGEKLQNVNDLTKAHPSVRQHYFWTQVADWRNEHNSEPKDQFEIFDDYENVRPEPEDLEWLIRDIAKKNDRMDRKLALRLAIELWVAFDRRWRDRRRILKAIANDDSLRSIFNQLTKGSGARRLRRFWNRHIYYRFGRGWWWQQRLRRMRILWSWLRSQWFLLRHIERLKSGNETRWLLSLVNEALEGHSQWSDIDWQILRKKRWRMVTWATRQGSKNTWRKFVPKLPCEGDPSKTDYEIIVGLVGIQAGRADNEIDFSRLGDDEAEIAVRYAINELNGFAPWLRELAVQRPESVRRVLSECVRGEWAFKAGRGHAYEVMHDLVWHGDTLIHLVKETLLDLLNSGDPPNHTILRYALTILLAQKERPISELSTIVLKRITGYRLNDPGFTLWMAVWLQIDASPALAFLQEVLNSAYQPDKTVLQICSALSGEYRDRSPLVPNPSYMRSEVLHDFILLVYVHIQPGDDIDRAGSGVYTPEERDHVQNFRTGLLSRLAASEEVEATNILRELAHEPIMAPHRDWILHLLDQRLERKADLPQWNPKDIRSFAEEHEVDPKTDRDLFKIACKRLIEIKNNVEKSDNSWRDELRLHDEERKLRQWLARKLNERSRQRYTVPQEEEIDQQERPDLRFENPHTDPVSIEVKWADKWTVNELLNGLEKQLVDQYLRAHNSKHGVYILAVIGNKKYWQGSSSQEHLSFPQVVEAVRARAKELVRERVDVENLAVSDIDFRAPEPKS